jgi:acyl-CoA thioester hydrolase
MSEEPPVFPVTIEFDVHWGDMDAFGHANNARYFTWFESCRTAYFMRIGLRIDGPSPLGPILAHVACDYLRPIVYPARLVCGARVPKIGNTSFAMHYALWERDKPAEWCAHGESVIVMMDYSARQKVRVPDDLRRAIGDVEVPEPPGRG